MGRAEGDIVEVGRGGCVNAKQRQCVPLSLLQHSQPPFQVLLLPLALPLLLPALGFPETKLLDQFLGFLPAAALDLRLLLPLNLNLVLQPADYFTLVKQFFRLLINLKSSIVKFLLEPLI